VVSEKDERGDQASDHGSVEGRTSRSKDLDWMDRVEGPMVGNLKKPRAGEARWQNGEGEVESEPWRKSTLSQPNLGQEHADQDTEADEEAGPGNLDRPQLDDDGVEVDDEQLIPARLSPSVCSQGRRDQWLASG